MSNSFFKWVTLIGVAIMLVGVVDVIKSQAASGSGGVPTQKNFSQDKSLVATSQVQTWTSRVLPHSVGSPYFFATLDGKVMQQPHLSPSQCSSTSISHSVAVVARLVPCEAALSRYVVRYVSLAKDTRFTAHIIIEPFAHISK